MGGFLFDDNACYYLFHVSSALSKKDKYSKIVTMFCLNLQNLNS